MGLFLLENNRSHTLTNLLKELDGILTFFNLYGLERLILNFNINEACLSSVNLFHLLTDAAIDNFVALSNNDVSLEEVNHFCRRTLDNFEFSSLGHVCDTRSHLLLLSPNSLFKLVLLCGTNSVFLIELEGFESGVSRSIDYDVL